MKEDQVHLLKQEMQVTLPNISEVLIFVFFILTVTEYRWLLLDLVSPSGSPR